MYISLQVFQVLVVLRWTDLFDRQTTGVEKTKEGLTQSCSNIRRLSQTSHSRGQSVLSSEYLRVDTSSEHDTAVDSKQSDTLYDAQAHVAGAKHAYTCEIRNKKYTKISRFESHICIHREKPPFNCNVCNKKFRQSYHMRIHTGERPFCCEVCNKKFTWSGNLQRHMRSHKGESPFSCEVCDETFTQKSSLNYHMYIHTDERPFSCEVCKKKIIKSQLKHHMLIHTTECLFSGEVSNKEDHTAILRDHSYSLWNILFH